MNAQKKGEASAVIRNRRARFDYEIKETVEAGIVLTGSEVKALRLGKASLMDAHAGEKMGEMWLLNLSIGVYESSVKHYRHEEKRARKILVSKRQRDKWLGLVKRDKYSIIPIKLYFNTRGFAKVELGLGRGKQKSDKRQQIKDREWQRRQARLV